MAQNQLGRIRAYHETTKHHYRSFAAGPGRLDWANQPEPFRRYDGAPLIALERDGAPNGDPPVDAGYFAGLVPAAPVDGATIARLLYDALALSAWKSFQGSRWALRVNPSSGNLHPTEGYLVCGPTPGLCDRAMVAHYAPAEHALEVRHWLPEGAWRLLSGALPPGAFLVGFTTIVWREAWKYGDRAYRYTQLDVGHALGALAAAAGGLGWSTVLWDGPGTADIERLLGIAHDTGDAEREHGDCLVIVASNEGLYYPEPPRREFAEQLGQGPWLGRANRLSAEHVTWQLAESAPDIASKPSTPGSPVLASPVVAVAAPHPAGPRLRKVIRGRRSAVDMDGKTAIDAAVFYRILDRAMPGPGRSFGALLPWRASVHMALFVHRVAGLVPGLYLALRGGDSLARLRAALRSEFDWTTPLGCPIGLPLYLLMEGDTRALARRIACGQDIAADGCFSLGMLAEFDDLLAGAGAWFYPRLFWECGIVGQALYLAAEEHGLRGTGIGCFFDDGMHAAVGLGDRSYQSLYHFTVGGPVEDARLTTLAPYP